MAEILLSAVIHKDGDLYVADCPELGTVSQGKTIEEAIANLKEASELYLQETRLQPAPTPVMLTTFAVATVNA